MVQWKLEGGMLTNISWSRAILGLDTSENPWSIFPLPYGSFSECLIYSIPTVAKKDGFFEPVYFQNLGVPPLLITKGE